MLEDTEIWNGDFKMRGNLIATRSDQHQGVPSPHKTARMTSATSQMRALPSLRFSFQPQDREPQCEIQMNRDEAAQRRHRGLWHPSTARLSCGNQEKTQPNFSVQPRLSSLQNQEPQCAIQMNSRRSSSTTTPWFMTSQYSAPFLSQSGVDTAQP